MALRLACISFARRLYIGLAGLATDQATFHEKLKFRLAMYSLREVCFAPHAVQQRASSCFTLALLLLSRSLFADIGAEQERDIKPASFGKLVSTLLYERR